MKIIRIEQRSPEWNDMRRGKVTGTILSRVLGGKKTRESAFYEILAGRITESDGYDDESAMARGTRLESEARSLFEKKTGKKVEQVGFVIADWHPNVGYSPDGLIKVGKKYLEDIEIKCLSSANHVRAMLTKKVPDDYLEQIIIGFMVNDEMKRRHVVFYDPRITVKPYFVITIDREEVADRVEEYTGLVKEFLKELDVPLSKLIKL